MTDAAACPRCRRTLLAASCAGCGADLTALRQVVELADRQYNRGLRAAQAGRWHEASECLAVTLALRPDDLGATVLAARVARRQGRSARVAELADAVERLDPGNTELADLRARVPALLGLRAALPDDLTARARGLPRHLATLAVAVRAPVSRVLARRSGGGADV